MNMAVIQHILALIKKELRIYFNSPIAYVFLFFYLTVASWLFVRTYFINGQGSMQPYFDLLPWFFLFFVSAITMRLFSEEKKQGTIETLMTLPVHDYEVVLGKFLASLFFLTITMLLTLSIPLMIVLTSNPDGGQIFGSYVGAIFLGASFLSIGLFISSLTKNQIVAFIITLVACFGLYIASSPVVLFSVPKFLAGLIGYIGIASHYSSISRGVIDSRDIIYYLSLIGLFLYLTTKSLETRKYK